MAFQTFPKKNSCLILLFPFMFFEIMKILMIDNICLIIFQEWRWRMCICLILFFPLLRNLLWIHLSQIKLHSKLHINMTCTHTFLYFWKCIHQVAYKYDMYTYIFVFLKMYTSSCIKVHHLHIKANEDTGLLMHPLILFLFNIPPADMRLV